MPEPISASSLITLTEAAAKKAKALLEKTGRPASLRVRVLSGGCSGMEYKLEPDFGPPQPGDQVVEDKDIKIYLDPKGLLYMAGSQLDYVSGLMGSGFRFKNPNAVAECSCGESFTV